MNIYIYYNLWITDTYKYIGITNVNTYILYDTYIGGWGVSPTGKSYLFRSCVRASEAACGWGTLLFPWRGFKSSKNDPVSCRVVPLPLAVVPLPNSLVEQF